MSKAGSTRSYGESHRGRDFRRSSRNQAFPVAATSVFQSQCTPTVSSSRRRRGYQPDEMNRKEKSEPEDIASAQAGGVAESSTAVEYPHEISKTDSKPASVLNSGPHQRVEMKGEERNGQPVTQTQLVKMDASHPEFDLVHFDGVSEPHESESSSFQIITQPRPSCWSAASLPKAVTTEWNSVAADIDRPARPSLPIYRFPKPESKAKRELASSPLHGQHAKLKQQANGFMPKEQKPFEINRPPPLASSTNNEAQAQARVGSLDDGHSADSLPRKSQLLRHKARLDGEQASQTNQTQEEVLPMAVHASPNVELESNKLKTSNTRDTPQAEPSGIKETSDTSFLLSSQAKKEREPTPPGKQNSIVPPHLRVQSDRPEKDNMINPLPPHLRFSTHPSTNPATEITVHGEGPEDRKRISSELQAKKLPPHLQVPSPINIRATKGPLSVTTPLHLSQHKGNSYRPVIDMDEEIAATQPILDVDEEIVAGLRAEEMDPTVMAEPVNSNFHETNDQVVYVPPQTETFSSRSKAFASEPKSMIDDEVTNSRIDKCKTSKLGAKTRSNSLTLETHTSIPQVFTTKREHVELAPTSNDSTVLDGPEPSVKKGKEAVKGFGTVDFTSELIGWDGKMNQPPVGEDWDRRLPFDPRSHERLSVIKAWREEHAADPEESKRLVVNTASADFQTGEGLTGGDMNVLSPINKVDHETLASNDDFSQARRHQNAAAAIKDYEAKIAAKPKVIPSGIEGMTKEERRSLRRALIEAERTRSTLPNPHAPAANIYLRPAEFKDMGQVMNIYNHYVRMTSFVLDLNPVDELYWRSRLQEAENERNPFVVAVHMGERSCRYHEDIIRKKQENIVGFAVAADFGNKTTMYHSSVELELMVHPQFLHQGIGRTSLDRILAALSVDHNLLDGAPFLAHNDICHWVSGGSRQAKAIIVNIHYPDGEEDTVDWRKQWLSRYGFQHVGTLPHVGFRKGKLVNTCQLVLNTSTSLGR